MYETINTAKYKKDTKILKKQGKDKNKLIEVIDTLKAGKPLDQKYRDHNLIGNYIGCRECHIEPDWLLIYRLDKGMGKLYLLRTGSHSELFNEELDIKELNQQLSQFID